MYFRTIFVSIVMLVVMGAGCNSVPESSQGPKVAATIFPIYDLVRVVGGEDVETVLVLPPGSSPHMFEPTPSTIKDLQGASLIFEVGHGLDSWVSSISASVPGLSRVVLDRAISLRMSDSLHEHEDMHHEEGEIHSHGLIDPHYWLNPLNASIMVDTVVHELSQLVPERADNFVRRATDFKDELARKNVEWERMFGAISHKELITFHDAFGYFADHFGLEIVSTVEPFPGKEPTPQYILHLKEEIEEHGVTVLYSEPQISLSALETFATDNELSIAVLDPEGSGARSSYIEMIEYNVRTIVEHQQ